MLFEPVNLNCQAYIGPVGVLQLLPNFDLHPLHSLARTHICCRSITNTYYLCFTSITYEHISAVEVI